jgi:hypothetical protein
MGGERVGQIPVEGLQAGDAVADARGEVDEVAGAEAGVPFHQRTSELDVVPLERHHGGERSGELHGGTQRGESTDRKIRVEELLEDLGGGDQRLPLPHRDARCMVRVTGVAACP